MLSCQLRAVKPFLLLLENLEFKLDSFQSNIKMHHSQHLLLTETYEVLISSYILKKAVPWRNLEAFLAQKMNLKISEINEATLFNRVASLVSEIL